MNTCETCHFWQLTETCRYSSVIFPYDPVTWEQEYDEDANAAKWGHKVRQCKHPRVLFYQRPDKGGAAVCDAIHHVAELITGPEFGCTLHTPYNAALSGSTKLGDTGEAYEYGI